MYYVLLQNNSVTGWWKENWHENLCTSENANIHPQLFRRQQAEFFFYIFFQMNAGQYMTWLIQLKYYNPLIALVFHLSLRVASSLIAVSNPKAVSWCFSSLLISSLKSFRNGSWSSIDFWILFTSFSLMNESLKISEKSGNIP